MNHTEVPWHIIDSSELLHTTSRVPETQPRLHYQPIPPVSLRGRRSLEALAEVFSLS